MAKKKKLEQVKEVVETVVEVEKPAAEEAPKAEEIVIEAPAKKSKMYRARIVRKKLVRE